MNTNGYAIEDGPNKDRLFDSLKYVCDSEKITVNFTVVVGYTMPPDDPRAAAVRKEIEATISSLEYEDGSGDKFNLTGYCTGTVERGSAFKAFYDSKRRKGHILFNR